MEHSEKVFEFKKDAYLQSNKATINYAVKTIWSLFLFNGLAATAILGAKTEAFFPSAVLFCFGAIAAIATMMLAYICSLGLAETWRPDKTYKNEEPILQTSLFGKKICLSLNGVEKVRIFAILTAAASLVLAIIGVLMFCARIS